MMCGKHLHILKAKCEKSRKPGQHSWFRLLEEHSGASLQAHQIFMGMSGLILAHENLTPLFQLPLTETHTHTHT